MPRSLFDDYLEEALRFSDNRRLEGSRDAFAENLIFESLAGRDPFAAFGEHDLFGGENPFSFASRAAHQIGEPATTAGGLLASLALGFVEGFTMLPVGRDPNTTAEGIAGSIGHLMGFVGMVLPFGWVARGLGLLGRLGIAGARTAAVGARMAQRAGAGTVGGIASRGLGLAARSAGPKIAPGLSDAASAAARMRSAPMAIADAAQRRLFSSSAGKSLLKMTEGRPVLRQMIEGGTHLGIAMGASDSIRALFEEESFLTGTVPRILGSALWGAAFGGALDIGIANMPGLNRMTTGAKMGRAALGSFVQGGVAYGMGARDAELVYEALLGGYFGAMQVPWQVHHARQALFREVPDPLRHVAHRTEEALRYADELGLKGEGRELFLRSLQQEAEDLYRPEEALYALRRFFRRFSEAMRDLEESPWTASDHEAFMERLEKIDVTLPEGEAGRSIDDLAEQLGDSGAAEMAEALAAARAGAVDQHASSSPLKNAAVRLAEKMASVGPDGEARDPKRSEVIGIVQVITEAAYDAESFGAFLSRVERIHGGALDPEHERALKPFFTEAKARVEAPHYAFNAVTGELERLEGPGQRGFVFAPDGSLVDTGVPIGLLHRVMVSEGLLPPDKSALGEGVRVVDMAILPDPDGGPHPVQGKTYEVDWAGEGRMWSRLLAAMRSEGYHLFSGVGSTGKFVFVPYNLGEGVGPELRRIAAEFRAAGIDLQAELERVIQIRAQAEGRPAEEVREEALREFVSNVRYWERMHGAERVGPEDTSPEARREARRAAYEEALPGRLEELARLEAERAGLSGAQKGARTRKQNESLREMGRELGRILRDASPEEREQALRQLADQLGEAGLADEPAVAEGRLERVRQGMEEAASELEPLDLSGSARKTRYFGKDQAKAARANKFIGRGSEGSSTEAYREAVGRWANVGSYTAEDVVFISAEGAREGRVDPNFREIQRAIDAGATLVTDNARDRERRYNFGERQVAHYLRSRGYEEVEPGVWRPGGLDAEAPPKAIEGALHLRDLLGGGRRVVFEGEVPYQDTAAADRIARVGQVVEDLALLPGRFDPEASFPHESEYLYRGVRADQIEVLEDGTIRVHTSRDSLWESAGAPRGVSFTVDPDRAYGWAERRSDSPIVIAVPREEVLDRFPWTEESVRHQRDVSTEGDQHEVRVVTADDADYVDLPGARIYGDPEAFGALPTREEIGRWDLVDLLRTISASDVRLEMAEHHQADWPVDQELQYASSMALGEIARRISRGEITREQLEAANNEAASLARAPYTPLERAEDLWSMFDRLHVSEASEQGHFIRDVLEFNRRTQIWSSNYYPVRPELLTFQSGQRKGQRMRPRMVLVDDQELFRPEYGGMPEADDGGAYIPTALLEALVEAGDLPRGASYVKPFIEAVLEGGGLFLGKLAFHQPLSALDEALMRANPDGGLVLVPRSAAKQQATAKGYTYRLVDDDGRPRLEFGERRQDGSIEWGVEPEAHELPAESIRLSTGTVDDAPLEAGRGATFFRQLFSTLTPEQVGRGAYEALHSAVLESAWVGDPEANQALAAYLREPGDSSKLRAVEEAFGRIGIEQWVRAMNEDPPEALRTLFFRRVVAEEAGVDLDRGAAEAFLEGWRVDEPREEGAAQRVLRETDLALARLGKGLSGYQRQALRAWIVKRLTNPTWRSGGKAIMSVSGVDTEAAGMTLTETNFWLDSSHRRTPVRDPETGEWTTLGELHDAGRAVGLEATVARVPIDDVSGAQVLTFAGFTDLSGGGIYLHPHVKRWLGGADNDIDSANFYFGLPEAYHEGLKRARLSQEENADLIDQKRGELARPPENLALDSPVAMFDSFHRAYVANQVSFSQNRMTGTAVNARARLHAMYSAANQSRVVDAEGVASEGVLESRVYMGKEGTAAPGLTVRFHANDDGGQLLRSLGSAAIQMSVDVAKVGGMVSGRDLQERLLAAAFPRIEVVLDRGDGSEPTVIRVTAEDLYRGVLAPVQERDRLEGLIERRDRIARNQRIPEAARREAVEQVQGQIDELLVVTLRSADTGEPIEVRLPERISLFDTAYGRLAQVNNRLYGRDRERGRPWSEDEVVGAHLLYPEEVGRSFLSDVSEKVAQTRIDFGLLRSVLRDPDRLGAFLHAANNVLADPSFRHVAPMLAGLGGDATLRIPYAKQMGILHVLSRYYGAGAEGGFDLSRDAGIEALAHDAAAYRRFKVALFAHFSPDRRAAFDEAAESGRKGWGQEVRGPRDYQVRTGSEGEDFSQKRLRLQLDDGRVVTVEEAAREAYARVESEMGRELTEAERREIYQRAFDAWARQNPDQVDRLAKETRGRRLVSPDFNRDGTNEAEALAEVLTRRRGSVSETPAGRERAIRRLLEQTEHFIENDVRDVASVRTVAEFFDYAGRDEPLARHLMGLVERVKAAYTEALAASAEAGEKSNSLALAEVRRAYQEAQEEVLRAVAERNTDPEVLAQLGVDGLSGDAALDLFDAMVLSTVGQAEAVADGPSAGLDGSPSGRARTAYHRLGSVMARRHVLAAFQRHYEEALGMSVSSTQADVAARVRATDQEVRAFFAERLLEGSPEEALRRTLRENLPRVEGFGLERLSEIGDARAEEGAPMPERRSELDLVLDDALAVLQTYPALREDPGAVLDLFRGLTGKATAGAVTAHDVAGFASEVKRWKNGATFLQRLLRGDVAARLREGQEAAEREGKPWRWWHTLMFSETVGRELREKDLELVLSERLERPGERRRFQIPDPVSMASADESTVVKAKTVSAGWADVRSRFERVIQLTGLALDQATQASERDERELERRFEYLALGIEDAETGESGLEVLMRFAVREHEHEGAEDYLRFLRRRYRLGALVHEGKLSAALEDVGAYAERLEALQEEAGALERRYVFREPGEKPVELTGREIVDRIKRDVREAVEWLYENRVALSDAWLRDALPKREHERFGLDIDLEKLARSFVRVIDQGLQPVDVERDLGRMTHDQQAFFAYEALLHHLTVRMARSEVKVPEAPDEVTSLFYRPEVTEAIERQGLGELRVLPDAERTERLRALHEEALQAYLGEKSPDNKRRLDDLTALLDYFEARVPEDDPRRIWEGVGVYSQYRMDLALALGEITPERHFKAEMRQKKPFKRTPKRTGYWPHNGFEPNAVLDHMVELTREAREGYHDRLKTIDNAEELALAAAEERGAPEQDIERIIERHQAWREDVRERFESDMADLRVKALATAGKTPDPEDLLATYARSALSEGESLDKTMELLDSFGAERRGGFSKKRTMDFPGYDETLSALFRYAGQVSRATYKGLGATLSLNAIRSFERQAPYGEDDSRAWGRWMRLHVRDALGYPSLMPDEYLSDPAFPVRRSPYYWLSDEAMARRGGRFNRFLVRVSGLHRLSEQEREALGVVRGRALTDAEAETLEAERLERMSQDPDVLAERYKRASELEGKYEMATLLFSMKTGALNLVGGATNTYIWTGAAPMVEARRFDTWKRINPEWESMDDVHRWAYEHGVVEEFMRHEVSTERAFQEKKAQAFWQEARRRIQEDRTWGSLAELKELASRHGLTDRFVETTAFFMQTTERALRLNAFLSSYLEARRTIGDPLGLDVSDPWLIEQGKRGVKATQFLYSAPFRPSFARTSWGKIYSRFKLWSWNSVVFRRQVMDEAAGAGYRPGSAEFERLQRMMTADLFVIALAGMLPYTLMEQNLPAPYHYFKDIAEYLLGDEDERRRAFFGTHSMWPYPLTPLQELTPPIARLAQAPVGVFNEAMDRIMSRRDETGSLYLYATLFPGGRLARDVGRSLSDPTRAPEYLAGVPLTSISYVQAQHRDRTLRARALPGVMRALAESPDGLTQNELVELMQTSRDKSGARKALRDALESGAVVRTREKRGAGGGYAYVYRVAGEGGQALRRDALLASFPAPERLFEGATSGLRGF